MLGVSRGTVFEHESIEKGDLAKGWPCKMCRTGKDSVIKRIRTRRDEKRLTESKTEARCIRAWWKSEALKNQEAESNERPAPGNNVTWRGHINDTPFYTFSVAESAVRRISLIATREPK